MLDMVIQTSPVAQAQRDLQPVMGVFHDTEVALEFGSSASQSARAAILGVCDVSCLPRFAIKGTGAATWLAGQGIAVPEAANQWVMYQDTLVLRLGISEFLLEAQAEEGLAASLAAIPAALPASLYPVARADAAMVLSGSAIARLLAEVCALDVAAELTPHRLLMTQVAGVSVTLLKQTLPAGDVIRLWADATYGAYLWHALTSIAEELGGGAVGLSCHFNMQY
jgi:sarcosine oxidase subunit gamma